MFLSRSAVYPHPGRMGLAAMDQAVAQLVVNGEIHDKIVEVVDSKEARVVMKAVSPEKVAVEGEVAVEGGFKLAPPGEHPPQQTRCELHRISLRGHL